VRLGLGEAQEEHHEWDHDGAAAQAHESGVDSDDDSHGDEACGVEENAGGGHGWSSFGWNWGEG
jgi:hypothetical protein